MRHYFLVAVDVDDAKLAEDRPPQPIGESLRDEIRTNLEDCRHALAVKWVVVQPLTPEIAERAAVETRVQDAEVTK